MDKMSRRGFLRRGAKLAAAAGFGGLWPGTTRIFRAAQNAPTVPSTDPHPAPIPAGFFATQTHFGQFRTGIDELLDLIKSAGIGWIRDEVYWSEVEKKRGEFTFSPQYDRYLKAAQARGLRVLLILDFGNPLYAASDKTAPATDAERRAFARYCREVVVRCRPLGVRHYEIWNEPNSTTFWRPRPDPEAYAALLRAAYAACKEADPGSTVIGCSPSGADLDFIGRVFAAGGGPFMDAVSFHPYCSPLAPEDRLLKDIAKVKSIAAGKPLWLTEFGYPSSAGAAGVDEDTQASYLVRAFLLARTSPAVERLFWYDFQNDGLDRDEPEHNFGLVRMDRTPKPAYAACLTMISLIEDLSPAEHRVVGKTHLLRFGDEKEPLFAVWRSGGAETTEISCPNGAYRVIERDGESRTVEASGQVLEVQASEKPRYIVRYPR